MVQTNQYQAVKAYGLLAEQPSSVAGLPLERRSQIVISALLDAQGATHILSRYADEIWDLSTYVDAENTAESRKKLHWKQIPTAFREACKSVIYNYWKLGREGWSKPVVGTLKMAVNNFGVFTKYLENLGVSSLSDVQPLHIANFVHQQKMKGFAAKTLANQFASIELLYQFNLRGEEGLSFQPWHGSSANEMAGTTGDARDRGVGKTPLIPESIQQRLFAYAEGVLKGAFTILDERDAGIRSAYKDSEVALIRDACFFLLGSLTGMRSSELSAIKIGAGRTEVKDGITFHWVTSVEYKTKKGVVDYMMPLMGHEILRLLERWSAPYRQRIDEKIARWEGMVEIPDQAKHLKKLRNARANKNLLFLGLKDPVAVSGSAWGVNMASFAKKAGIDWALAPHQLRRLYAYTFVRHRLGNVLFLREQFKHSSLSMSQLYASNPRQNQGLYDEILDELHSQKVDVVLRWLDDDELLSGGAGHKIMKMRAHDFPDRNALVTETSDKLSIRSTGHSWCLAQDEGCGGSGLYEKTRCGGCGNGVIDSSFKAIWQGIYDHQRELLDEMDDLGPGAAARVKRDLSTSRRVLADLGVELDKDAENGESAAS